MKISVQRESVLTGMSRVEYTACFSGHRKLAGAYEGTPVHDYVQFLLRNAIERLYTLGVRAFISGMALGVDQIAAREVVAFKDALPINLSKGVFLIAAIPHHGYESRWPIPSQKEYEKLLEEADAEIYVNEGEYSPWSLNERNIWMVDHSDHVVIVWDGRKSGGTYHTYRYANTLHRKTVYLVPHRQERGDLAQDYSGKSIFGPREAL